MPDSAAVQAGATASAIVANAERLGLTWDLTLASAVTVKPSLMILRDGDTEPISATTTGGMPKVGDRVWVLRVPPSGIYILGPASDAGSLRTPWVQVFTGTGSNAIDVNIPSSIDIYSLQLDWTLRDTLAGFQAATLRMLVNSDTSANYGYRYIQASGATGSALSHTAAFGTASAVAGIYATGGATATRFASGRIVFPAYNAPHPGQLGYTFESTFENAASDGWYLTGGGFYGPTAVAYNRISLLAQVGAVWAAGSQIVATGFRP